MCNTEYDYFRHTRFTSQYAIKMFGKPGLHIALCMIILNSYTPLKGIVIFL